MEGYKSRHKGTEETYSERKGIRTVCPFPSCGKNLALGYLQSQVRTQYGMDACGSIITERIALALYLYKLSFKHQSGCSRGVPCPVED